MRKFQLVWVPDYLRIVRVVELMFVFGDALPAGSYQLRRKHKFLACDKFLLGFFLKSLIFHIIIRFARNGVVKKLFFTVNGNEKTPIWNRNHSKHDRKYLHFEVFSP